MLVTTRGTVAEASFFVASLTKGWQMWIVDALIFLFHLFSLGPDSWPFDVRPAAPAKSKSGTLASVVYLSLPLDLRYDFVRAKNRNKNHKHGLKNRFGSIYTGGFSVQISD